MTTDDLLERISLLEISVEEMALLCALMGRSAQGARYLEQAFGHGYSEILAQEWEIAASHSLLARGWLTPSQGGPALTQETRKQFAPFFYYDYFLNVLLQEGQNNSLASIYVLREPGQFAAHFAHLGCQHALEFGPLRLLPAYLKLLIGLDQPLPHQGGEAAEYISMLVFIEAILRAQTPLMTLQVLKTAGWPEEPARWLSNDLANASFQASVLRVDANHEVPPNNPRLLESARSFFFLKGQERMWYALFDSQDDRAHACLRTAAGEEIERSLTLLVSEV